jgi:hypothetical protein
MGAVVSYLRPAAIRQQEFIHNVYLRAPAVEMAYDAMRELDKGNGFYPLQIVLCIAYGHTSWDGLMDCMFKAYKIDPDKVNNMYWVVWVTKHVPTFSEESGEAYTAISKIVNDRTDAKVLASYIVDPEWEFYFTLEERQTTGYFMNSATPTFTSHLMPTENALLPLHSKNLQDSV